MTKPLTLGVAALAGALALPVLLAAQEPPPPAQAQQPPTELVFEREVFSYPTFPRRNPFRPLSGGNQGGPRFDQLRLMGIIYSGTPAESTAMLGTSTVTVSEDGTATVGEGQSWSLKVGQSIGNIRLVEIRRDQVVVEVEEFGLTEQKTMQLQIRRQGGTP